MRPSPRRRICGRARRQIRIAPRRFTSSRCRACSSLTSSSDPACGTPALFTTAHTPPPVIRPTSPIASTQEEGSATSTTTVRSTPPARRGGSDEVARLLLAAPCTDHIKAGTGQTQYCRRTDATGCARHQYAPPDRPPHRGIHRHPAPLPHAHPQARLVRACTVSNDPEEAQLWPLAKSLALNRLHQPNGSPGRSNTCHDEWHSRRHLLSPTRGSASIQGRAEARSGADQGKMTDRNFRRSPTAPVCGRSAIPR